MGGLGCWMRNLRGRYFTRSCYTTTGSNETPLGITEKSAVITPLSTFMSYIDCPLYTLHAGM